MGKIHTATCKCGYHGIVRVGGNRRTFTTNSLFPFYCDKCGLVSVNFRDTPIHCPKCESLDVKEYGKHPISIESSNFPIVQCFNYGAHKEGNLCPDCKEMTLEFQSADISFD